MSLTMFSAVSRSISSAFFRPTAVWCATARSSSASSSSNARSRGDAARSPSCSSPAASGAISGSSSTAPLWPSRMSAISCAARRAGRCRPAGRADELELVGLGVDPPDLAGVGPQQLARAARDRVVEVLAQRDRRERLAQLRERGQRVDAPARALVELRVLDRAATSDAVCTRKLRTPSSNSRGASVWRTTTPITSSRGASTGTATIDWKLLLLELRHVLHARVLERVVADELRRLRAAHPAGQPLVDPPAERARRGASSAATRAAPAARLHEVDEGRVAVRRVGRDLDDPVQHAVSGQRRRDGLDDRVQRLVLALHAGQSVAATRDR